MTFDLFECGGHEDLFALPLRTFELFERGGHDGMLLLYRLLR